MHIHATIAVVLTIVMALLAAPERLLADGYPDKLYLLSLLEKKDFKNLNQVLETIQGNSEKDIAREIDVQLAFDTFSTSRPDLEPLLSEWVTTHPDSYAAHLANGTYFAHQAWLKRGKKWAKDTTQVQLEQMNLSFAKSIQFVTGALDRHPALIEGYAILINAAMAMSEPAREQHWVRQALEKSPASFRIRRSHMQTLLPRWGGSYEAMRNFARESQTYSDLNPRLKVLLGFVLWDKGRVAVGNKDYGNATQLYTQAVEKVEHAEFYASRADVYERINDYDKALADTNKALELYPHDPYVLADRASILAKLDRFDEAVADMELASKLDPGDARVEKVRNWISESLTHRGYELQRSGQYDEAISRFSMAAKVNPAGHETFYWRARAYADKGRFDLSETDLYQAIRLNPRYFEAYKTLDWVLARDHRWDEVITHWNRLIQYEPDNANAYLERAGTFRHKGNMAAALADLKKACDLGNGNACQIRGRAGAMN